MNWKASLAGALVVAAAGLAVGFGVGGKTTDHTSTQTTTVDQTVTVTTTLASASSGSSGNTTTSGSSSSSTGSGSGGVTSNQQYYSGYLANQNTSDGSNASLDGNPSTIELKGQTYSHAIAFDLSPNTSNTNSESFQLPIPGFKHFTASLAGLQTSTDAGESYKLTIYKNNDNPGATALYSNTFSGPSGTHPISFDTQGATDLLFVWDSTAADANTTLNTSDDVFVVADPVVNS